MFFDGLNPSKSHNVFENNTQGMQIGRIKCIKVTFASAGKTCAILRDVYKLVCTITGNYQTSLTPYFGTSSTGTYIILLGVQFSVQLTL